MAIGAAMVVSVIVLAVACQADGEASTDCFGARRTGGSDSVVPAAAVQRGTPTPRPPVRPAERPSARPGVSLSKAPGASPRTTAHKPGTGHGSGRKSRHDGIDIDLDLGLC
ncbi:hypothetical protein [Streptomyces sp. NPDC047070]|uniref:hypothetical protein n=1 Tax=Streptomyces sp. NPDC047070 TaxID=3154923 RepID=UPI003453A962